MMKKDEKKGKKMNKIQAFSVTEIKNKIKMKKNEIKKMKEDEFVVFDKAEYFLLSPLSQIDLSGRPQFMKF
jgi:hypothetical protein